jgi:hypothetical protein
VISVGIDKRIADGVSFGVEVRVVDGVEIIGDIPYSAFGSAESRKFYDASAIPHCGARIAEGIQGISCGDALDIHGLGVTGCSAESSQLMHIAV